MRTTVAGAMTHSGMDSTAVSASIPLKAESCPRRCYSPLFPNISHHRFLLLLQWRCLWSDLAGTRIGYWISHGVFLTNAYIPIIE